MDQINLHHPVCPIILVFPWGLQESLQYTIFPLLLGWDGGFKQVVICHWDMVTVVTDGDVCGLAESPETEHVYECNVWPVSPYHKARIWVRYPATTDQTPVSPPTNQKPSTGQATNQRPAVLAPRLISWSRWVEQSKHLYMSVKPGSGNHLLVACCE